MATLFLNRKTSNYQTQSDIRKFCQLIENYSKKMKKISDSESLVVQQNADTFETIEWHCTANSLVGVKTTALVEGICSERKSHEKKKSS
jgi:hypothetical protein